MAGFSFEAHAATRHIVFSFEKHGDEKTILRYESIQFLDKLSIHNAKKCGSNCNLVKEDLII